MDPEDNILDANKLVNGIKDKDNEIINKYVNLVDTEKIEGLMNIYDKKILLLKRVKNRYVDKVWDELFRKFRDNKYGLYYLYAKRHDILIDKYKDIYIKFVDPVAFKQKYIHILNNNIKTLVDSNRNYDNTVKICSNCRGIYKGQSFLRNFNIAIQRKYTTTLFQAYNNYGDKTFYYVKVYVFG